MLRSLSTILFLNFFMGLQRNMGSDAVRIQILPEFGTSKHHLFLKIACSLDAAEDEGKEVMMLEVYKNDQPPIAFLNSCNNITYGMNTRGRFQAEGHLSKSAGTSYLTLKLNKRIEEDDYGVYTCRGHVQANTGFRTESATDNLSLEKVGVFHCIKELQVLKKEIDSLKQKDIKLNEKISYKSAFSATKSNGTAILTVAGQVLILPDVLMKQGPGYDPTTGVFTAPRKGLYDFNLVATATGGCHYFEMTLKVNDKDVTVLVAGSPNFYDQSAVSSVVNLIRGDRVYVVMKDSNCRTDVYTHIVFTGYLFRASW